jgi:hypothetical protein
MDFSVAPAGAFSIVKLKPTARAVGYYRALLRSFRRMKSQSKAFAVGLVVAFQRLKAASLVSAKRNFNVGDSTWPSQNTTLALPSTEWRDKIASHEFSAFEN